MSNLTLAIETSCDDTSVALVKGREVLSLFIQTHLEHQDFGGVVPEIASRKHAELLEVLVKKTLKENNITMDDIDSIGVTNGPGLLGSLLVGVMFAKGLAQANNKPLIGINHIFGHISANFIENELKLPYIALVVSGGHTELLYTEDHFHFEVIGKTRDDAAGEAFDKGAKLLNLPYPGGPVIDKISKEIDNPSFEFPIAMKQKNNFDFSFSGLKTSLLYFLKENERTEENVANIAASYQKAIVDTLIYKLKNAVKKYNVDNIVVAGGVSGNSKLRDSLHKTFKHKSVSIPSLKYCTDNAAMIGVATNMLKDKWENNWNKEYTLEAFSNMRIDKKIFS